MRVFFLAGIDGNTGPANANRAFFEHWPSEDEVRILSGSGLSKLVSLVKGLLWCEAVVTSGPGRVWDVVRRIVRVRGVATVGYCHGYLPYENMVNNQGFSDKEVRAYCDWLERVDLVATNSELQKEFLVEAQPTLEGKVIVARLGVDPFRQATRGLREKGTNVIAASGGTRPIKGNDVVARAVGLLRSAGRNVELRVYGRRYSENAELDELVRSCGRYMEQVSKSEFERQLGEVDVFVMNSRHDSFGLSALDALESGCSLLLSRNCGVKEILALGENDYVDDCENAKEVAEKIEGLLVKPNASRLYGSIDFTESSWDRSASVLREACATLVNRKAK